LIFDFIKLLQTILNSNSKMESKFKNPVEKVEERGFIDPAEISEFEMEEVHKQISGTNHGAYCLDHHSIEARTTKIRHSNCKLFEKIDIGG